MGEPRKRIELIDMLRGFAAIAMIIGHSIIVYPVDASAIQPFDSIQTIIYMFHMELFFILAGAVYHCSDYISFAKSKVKRLLVPYAFFGVVAILFHAIGGESVHNQLGLMDGVKKTLFNGGNYWFLYTLFIICMVFPLIEKIRKKVKYFDLIVVGGGIADTTIC